MTTAIPNFDEWVAYCFEQGYADFHVYSEAEGKDFEAIESREEWFNTIPNQTLTEYAIRLFSSPSFIIDRYSDKQIADAIWFIFGVGSEYFHTFREKDVPVNIQTDLMRSIRALYTDLFDRVCNKHCSDLNGFFTNDLPVDSAVGMIWDMDGIECPLYHPKGREHLIDPSFEILEAALFQCQTASCKGSALHGLGHAHDGHPDRVEGIIDRYLALSNEPEHLCEYALRARTGRVQ